MAAGAMPIGESSILTIVFFNGVYVAHPIYLCLSQP